MKEMTTYLTFDGNGKEAMEFYAKCLDADLYVMPFSETPCPVNAEDKDRIAHAKLSKGSAVVMASDSLPGMPFVQGNNFSVAIGCESTEEADKFFAALGEGGKVTMPMQEMFWGDYFGMVTDRYGINWMFACPRPKPAA